MLRIESNIYKTICNAHTAKYPRDHITCQIDFVVHELSDAMQFVNTESIISNPRLFVENSEWHLSSVTTAPATFTLFSFSSPVLRVTMRLQRNPDYFSAVFVVPNFFLTIVVVFVPLLPINSGERLGLGCSLCLSFVMFLTMIDSAVPKTTNTKFIYVVMMSFVLAVLNVLHSIIMAWLLERRSNEVQSVKLLKPASFMQKLVQARHGDKVCFVFNLLYVTILIIACLVITLS